MIEHLKLLGLGINIGNDIKICILMYADDIILLANTEAELQSLLLALETWCKQWQLSVTLIKQIYCILGTVKTHRLCSKLYITKMNY